MCRTLRGMLYIILLATLSGCTMCQSYEDDTYAAYGGRWERHDRLTGRAGSILSDPGFTDESFDSGANATAKENLFRELDDPAPLPPR